MGGCQGVGMWLPERLRITSVILVSFIVLVLVCCAFLSFSHCLVYVAFINYVFICFRLFSFGNYLSKLN